MAALSPERDSRGLGELSGETGEEFGGHVMSVAGFERNDGCFDVLGCGDVDELLVLY